MLKTTEYRTKQGDMWDTISRNVYGDECYLSTLIQANQEHMNTVIFPVGVFLQAPKVNKNDIRKTIPPWKK